MTAHTSNWTILVDFDGTISKADSVDAMLERFAGPAAGAYEVAWENGRISAKDCMSHQVALMKVDAVTLDSFFDQIEIDPDFSLFVAEAERMGAEVRIVSDGLAPAIRRVLARIGLSHLPVHANNLIDAGDGRWRFQASDPLDCAGGCGSCKCRVANASVRRTLLVGDGRSDICVARNVDLVFAKSSLLAHCREHNLPHLDCPDFLTALSFLPGLEEQLPASIQAGVEA